MKSLLAWKPAIPPRKFCDYSQAEIAEFQEQFRGFQRRFGWVPRAARWAGVSVALVLTLLVVSVAPATVPETRGGVLLVAAAVGALVFAFLGLLWEGVLHCPACGEHLRRELGLFCPECGGRIVETTSLVDTAHQCADCGKHISARNPSWQIKHCTHCGVRLEEERR